MNPINAISALPDLTASAASGGAVFGAPAASTDFAARLGEGLQTLELQSRQASQNLTSFALGEPIATHDLVLSMEQAKLTLQLAVEVRNRLVDGYQELVRMQV